MSTSPADLLLALRAHALSLPGAHEDFPWGERVAKVGKKVFAFLGKDDPTGTDLGFSAKLPLSCKDVLARPYAQPTGYGLGKSGWVSVHLGQGDQPSLDELLAWVEESYRAVAPKRMVAQLDAAKGR